MRSLVIFCTCLMVLMLTSSLTCANELAETQAKLNISSDIRISKRSWSFDELEHVSKQYDMHFPNGTIVHASLPVDIEYIAKDIEEGLSLINNKIQLLLNINHSFRTNLILYPKKEFYLKTGAPGWTSAIFYKNKIKIPVDVNNINLKEIKRTIWHEYTHAYIKSLSGGNCPGWLDEGIAQLLEGPEPPALKKVLRNWLHKKDPVDLGLLQGGFTKLESSMVAPAYAQSMFAADLLIRKNSFPTIGKYLISLRDSKGVSSFQKVFGHSEEDFQNILAYQLKLWRSNRSNIKNISKN